MRFPCKVPSDWKLPTFLATTALQRWWLDGRWQVDVNRWWFSIEWWRGIRRANSGTIARGGTLAQARGRRRCMGIREWHECFRAQSAGRGKVYRTMSVMGRMGREALSSGSVSPRHSSALA